MFHHNMEMIEISETSVIFIYHFPSASFLFLNFLCYSCLRMVTRLLAAVGEFIRDVDIDVCDDDCCGRDDCDSDDGGDDGR